MHILPQYTNIHHSTLIPQYTDILEFIVAFKLSSPDSFSKFNLSIFYHPPYERTVWYYERANTELIRRAIDQFGWLRALSYVNVDEKVLSHQDAAQDNPKFHST